ncbi:glycosyltransferase family protein [Sphingopyxis yananensis]|uniref:hypothetical protein n=1 Tax=Sphingopyxis yananensis TaxID=2886687 RepID=UPI001D1096C1|nr:hypothetical protein [Sphingopyxis yananensis]
MNERWGGISERQIFWGIMALAAILRAVAAVPFMIGWYDEIWQYLEPAWSLVEGPWIQTWDFRDGIRSWLLPQFLSLPMALGWWLAPDSALNLFLPRLLMAALSLTVVGCATQLGLRLSRLHGLMAGVVAAVWFELIYFAPRTLSEPLGFSLFMGAVWLLIARRYTPNFRAYQVAGFLLGLCFAVRIQYAPMILILTIWAARTEWRALWTPMVLGGLAALGVDAAVNLAMGNMPFRWMVEAVRVNVIEGRADSYGVSPVTEYLGMMGLHWFLLFPAILILARKGARHYPILFWIAVVHILCHSLIGHKEFRFIMAGAGLLVVLAGLGSADMLRQVPRQRLALTTVTMLFLWMGGSAALANAFFQHNWSRGAALAEIYDEIRSDLKSCGIAFHTPEGSVNGSYALLRRSIPMYSIDEPAELARYASSYNHILTYQDRLADLPSGFGQVQCGDAKDMDAAVCHARRAGGCSGDPVQHHYNAWLERRDN